MTKCPALLGTLDKFYNMLDESFSMATLDPEKAHVFQRVEAMILWVLLSQDAPRLAEQMREIHTSLQKINEDMESNMSLNNVLSMDYIANQNSFLGCYLRSLTFGTDKIIKSGKSISLSVVNKVRENEKMVKFLKASPNTFCTEHLFELIFVYRTLDVSEKRVGGFVVENMYELFVDLRTIFFFYTQDNSLTSTSNYSYFLSNTAPAFIQQHLKLDRDYISIGGISCLSIFGLGALTHRYWNFLMTYVPDSSIVQAKYYDAALPFAYNIDKFRNRTGNLNKSWLHSGKQLRQIFKVELRNLCCIYDFLFYYSKLIEVEYDFGALKNTLLTIIRHNKGSVKSK